MTSLSLGQYLINDSPCHRIQKGATEEDIGQLLQKAGLFCWGFFLSHESKDQGTQ